MDKRIIGLATVDITDKEIDAVTKVLKSGKISPGNIQEQFENYVANKHGMKYGTFVNSGQSALHLSFEVLKMVYPHSINKVLCPATTYISTIFAAWNANLPVQLVDVNPYTYNMSFHKLRFSQNDIICPVNLMGISANHPDYRDCLLPDSNPIVEDNCESIFAPTTGYGDLMCLSFYAAHQITTGSGGMVCTNSKRFNSLIKSICNHGRADSNNLYTANRNETYDKSKKFIFDKVGFSFKMGDYMAALGLAQAERADEIIGAKIKVAHKLLDRLSQHSSFIQLPVKHGNTFMNFPIVVKNGKKDKLVAHLNNWQIETRDLMPILNQPIIKQAPNNKLVQTTDNGHCYEADYKHIREKKTLPVSLSLVDTAFYIGCHQGMTDDDIEYVGEVFDNYFEISI